MGRVERSAVLPALAVFGVALATGAVVVGHFRRLDVEQHRRTATELARGSALAIEQRFASALAAASTVAALVEEGASDRELDGVARKLLGLAGDGLSIQLARDGVISHVWPLKGNEAALGLDLVRHPVHGRFTRRVIESRAALLYGPFELVQGGEGLALRLPVTVRAGEVERFWGLASAILRVRVILEAARVAGLADAGFEYAIVRPGPAGAADEPIAGSRGGAVALGEAVRVPIELPGQRWRLDVVPRGGWGGPIAPGALPFAAILIALLAGLLAYRVGEHPAVLRREVAARTRELQAAHEQQRVAEEAQRQSQKLESIGLLAGGVAHDFNNLLAGIMGYADVIAADARTGSEAEEAARTIVQAAQRGADLTRRLLALARLGQHRQVHVDVNEMVREAGALLVRTLDKAIRLETRLEASLRHVLGDPGQLQQVILNLAVNARDAMPDGGVLAIETSNVAFDERSAPAGLRAGRYLALVVSDTGVGIPPGHRERIFEPFFTTKPEGKGSGLGLATVFGIVRGHAGVIQLQSEVGVGTRFVVYLPALEGEAEEGALEEAAAPRGAGVVLVVDDEEIVRRTAARVVASLGYEPAQVEGGQEALDWLESHPSPVAVLLDLAMPGMDGRTCFLKMRERHPALRVVLASGFSKEGRGEELLAQGAIAFVQKPFRRAELATALAAGQE